MIITVYEPKTNLTVSEKVISVLVWPNYMLHEVKLVLKTYSLRPMSQFVMCLSCGRKTLVMANSIYDMEPQYVTMPFRWPCN